MPKFQITLEVEAASQEDANLIQTRLQKFSKSFTPKDLLKLSEKLLQKINTIKLFV